MKKSVKIILVLLIAVAVAVQLLFTFADIRFVEDDTANDLLLAILPRLVCGVVFVIVLSLTEFRKLLTVDFKALPKQLLWCIPCFLVVIANFPASALISGNAVIDRSELTGLFILKCLSIGLLEETVFRGLIQSLLTETFAEKKHGFFLSVAISSALFGLFHLLNLFEGADVGSTLLQVGYSFLIGAMLSAVVFKTNNLWLCILLHAAFDVGGTIVPELGHGNFQDACFWVLTAIFGVICFIHVLRWLIKEDKKLSGNGVEVYNSANNPTDTVNPR